ncbi:hypothetical protein CWM47_15030 [Spirosoma pollinicola]|uniref:DUF6965 domain-containing protein n=2 Tax=Spirosoma pollinicola TaxID=2057025 RepID=A0A2K8YZH6_9BACT|nr:hypothetical protein CWM47_15030 [Spirosoma pollinicola]
MNDDMNNLLDFFIGLVLPETEFKITKQTSTSNLQKCVRLAMALAKDGNKPSVIRLRRIRDLLEKQSIEFVRPR